MKSPFHTAHHPQTGVPLDLRTGLQVVTAPNAGPMTFTGTQTYLLGEQDVAVIDPGPDDPAHLAAIEAALRGRRVGHIVVTHAHIDHSPLAAVLAEKTGAPVYGFGPANAARAPIMDRLGDLGGGEGIDTDFAPDILVPDAGVITGNGWQLQAIHTPGHLSNHLCFAWQGQGALFSGDHVMGWASTLVSPPDGDLRAFMDSLRKLQSRPEDVYFPGHGAVLEGAHDMIAYLLAHRLEREAQILAALGTGPRDVAALTAGMYGDVDKRLHGAAARNVLAHIIDLFERGIVAPQGDFSATAVFRLTE